MTKNESLNAIKVGVLVIFIHAISYLLTIIYFILENYQVKTLLASFKNEYAEYITFLLHILLGIGVYKKFRIASIVMFIYLSIILIQNAFEGEYFAIIFLYSLSLYFIGKAIQGTFAFHKLEKQETPKY